MTWKYWILLYTQTHCTGRGLRSTTIGAYQKTLEQFREYVRLQHGDLPPEQVSARIVLEYVTYLRKERDNGDSAVNRQVTILKNFYRAMVAMGHLLPAQNPLAHFPTMKGVARKLPTVLAPEEVTNLLNVPRQDTILGLRDCALLTLLYGTGIRASELAALREADVDLTERTIRVTGKGGHQRVIPLNEQVVQVLKRYRESRGLLAPTAPFFRSRTKKAMSRGAVYERVRRYSQLARIPKRVSPHTLRHTFATHLVQADVNIVVIRDLLGHRQLASTQIYLHLTAHDLRTAIGKHPVQRLAPTIEALLPGVTLPFQDPPRRRGTG
ncbi:MAG: tyrosine-type recombinase/integrase [Planctomycetes bacterium]|nr:tyrosine-type recombinase/integrase [Planctomycetota bacterium]